MKNLIILLIVTIAGVGLLSVWNMARAEGTKEGFSEKQSVTNSDLDYFVAVSNSIKKQEGREPTVSEVRTMVEDMKQKQVKIQNVDGYLKTKGISISKDSDVRRREKENESDVNNAIQKEASYRKENIQPLKRPQTHVDPVPKRKKESEPNYEVVEAEIVGPQSRQNKPKQPGYVTDVNQKLRESLVRDLNSIADKVEDMLEQLEQITIASHTSTTVKSNTAKGIPRGTETFEAFQAWETL